MYNNEFVLDPRGKIKLQNTVHISDIVEQQSLSWIEGGYHKVWKFALFERTQSATISLRERLQSQFEGKER